MDVVKHFGLSQDPFQAPEPGALAGETLTPEAARAYLAGRAAGAGGHDLFSPSALDLLAEASRGDVDRLRQLAGNALFHAAFDGTARVEDTHVRQAATVQGLWVPTQDPMRTAPAIAPMAAPPVHTISPELIEAAPAADVQPDTVVPHRRWWRRTPPLARLAIIVGLLLLSLPVVGFIIGAVKDSMSSGGSSYVPDDAVALEERATIDEAALLNPDAAAPEAELSAPSRPPVDLMAERVPAPGEPDVIVEPAPGPVTDTNDEPVPASEPVPDEFGVPAPEIETVPIEAPPVPQ